jgi:hypothetical protein
MIMKSDLQAVLDELRTEDRRTRAEPPTAEEMLAYRAGELSGDEEARVRELLICWPELLRALMTPYPDDDDASLPAEVVERQCRTRTTTTPHCRRKSWNGSGRRCEAISVQQAADAS